MGEVIIKLKKSLSGLDYALPKMLYSILLFLHSSIVLTANPMSNYNNKNEICEKGEQQ